MEKIKSLEIYRKLDEMFPNAKCELVYHNYFELLVATVLSAQTTDINVNKLTPILFSKYPTPLALSQANEEGIKQIIKPLGLSSNKSKNIIALSKILVEKHKGDVPANYDDLVLLPGVGRKTANVVLAEGFSIPRIGVDTHVSRVAVCLGFSKSKDDVVKIEEDLMASFPKELWTNVHLKLLFFGRYFCKAIHPCCNICPFTDICKK